MKTVGGKAVLYLSPLGKVTGSLIDSLDYLIALKRAGIQARLIHMGRDPTLPRRLVADRYTLDFDPLADALFLKWRWHLSRFTFDQVLVPYTTFRRISLFLKAAHTFVLPTMWMRRDSRRPFGWPLTRGRITYLLNPEQHSYRLAGVESYEKKLLLDCLQKPHRTEKNLLVNCQSSHKRHHPREIREALAHCRHHEAVLVLASGRTARAYERAGFQVLTPPVENLFSRFDQYLYLPPVGGYDENPRLLIESAWLGKAIVVPDEHRLSPQSARKHRQLREQVEDFLLTPEDPLIQRFRSG
ncbi:MAG: hypothetical protein ACP5I4_12935 [Oceanipulchritudo sp.]